MSSVEESFFLLNTRTICAFFSILVIECNVLMAQLFYDKDILEKVHCRDVKNPAILNFSLLKKE